MNRRKGANKENGLFSGYLTTSCRHWRQPVTVGRFVVTCSSGMYLQPGRNAEPHPDFGVYLDSGWVAIVVGYYPALIVDWPDMTAPKPESLIRLVDICLSKMRQGKVIDIGCSAGHGRTGTLLASLIVRVEHLDGATALREARRRYCSRACETRDQQESVINYAKRCEQMKRTTKQIVWELLDMEGDLPSTEIAKRLGIPRGTACSARDGWKKARREVCGGPKLSSKDQKAFEQRLDFRPKCPIVKNPKVGRQNECGGDRCAWWDTAYNMCVVRSLARLLDGILADLNQVRDKLAGK